MRLDEDPTQDNVLGGQDEDSMAAATAAAAYAESRQRISELLEAKPGTCLSVLTPSWGQRC